MGKASNTKKVARAASTGGGRTSRGKRPVGYYSFIAVAVILGSFLAYVSRQDLDSASAEPPTLEDHWHMAYGIYICEAFVPPLQDRGEDRFGVHTHGDGLVHLHPFSNSVTGRNATIEKFADQVGIEISSDTLNVPGQGDRKNGDKCGEKAGEVKAVVWDGATDETGTFVGGDPADIPLKDDGIVVLAFVAEDTKVEDIPKPSSVEALANPADESPEGSTTTAPPAGATPPPSDPAATSTPPAAPPSTSTP